MTLITVRHNQRENLVPLDKIEFVRTNPGDMQNGIIRLTSGREVLCSDIPYAVAQMKAARREAELAAGSSLFERIFGPSFFRP